MTKNIAMIPARIGSTRLPKKNLALLGGRPLISYAIQSALESGVFDRVVVNGDDEAFEPIAREYGAEFYLRPKHLGSSDARSDDVVYDFMQAHPADVVVWVNPIAPLQPAEEIRRVIEHFHNNGLDSLITVKEEQVHAVLGGEPLNFKSEGLFAKTQELKPVQLFVYSIMMWQSACFRQHYERDGYALLSGRLGYFPVSKESSVIIKYQEDLDLAEQILLSRKKVKRYYEAPQKKKKQQY